MRRFYVIAALLTPMYIYAESAQERLGEATAILKEIMATPDSSIPQDLLGKAHCVVIVPGLKQAALVVGGKYGRGFAICRRERSGWGAPAAVRVEGGSFGFQIGASSTDAVMLVMDERGMRRLLEDKFTLGAEASVAAGPVGRSATAQTDLQLSADILSWSRTKGVFAGVALQGATMRNDVDENQELYGRRLHSKDVLMTGIPAPAAAQPLIAILTSHSSAEAKNKPIESRAADALKDEKGADRTKTPAKKR